MSKRVMGISLISAILIFVAVILLALCTIPMKNTLENDKLTVKFIIGKEEINMKGAQFYPVPDEVNNHIIKLFGTSIGKKRAGNFMNTKTKTRFKFYLTGYGERVYFEIGNKKYLVDGLSN